MNTWISLLISIGVSSFVSFLITWWSIKASIKANRRNIKELEKQTNVFTQQREVMIKNNEALITQAKLRDKQEWKYRIIDTVSDIISSLSRLNSAFDNYDSNPLEWGKIISKETKNLEKNRTYLFYLLKLENINYDKIKIILNKIDISDEKKKIDYNNFLQEVELIMKKI